nr:bypass of stop codon protein 1-like [Dermatophagoides farinae]
MMMITTTSTATTTTTTTATTTTSTTSTTSISTSTPIAAEIVTNQSSINSGQTDPLIITDNVDLEKALILESSSSSSPLNDTILLQNVSFDPNFFDRINLDTLSQHCQMTTTTTTATVGGGGGLLPVTTIVDDDDDDDDYLDNLELQLLKDNSNTSPSSITNHTICMVGGVGGSGGVVVVDGGGGSSSGQTFLNSSSSDPLVSSTTAAFDVPPLQPTQHHQTYQLINEKLFLTTAGGLPISTLSLANIGKMVGSNVLAIISAST